MGSPLILRPVGTQDKKFLSVALFLNGTRPSELELKGCQGTFGKAEIVDPSFATYQNAPMGGLSKTGDALEAFREYLNKNGYEEVSL